MHFQGSTLTDALQRGAGTGRANHLVRPKHGESATASYVPVVGADADIHFVQGAASQTQTFGEVYGVGGTA